MKGIKKLSLIGESARTSNSYGRNMPYMRYTVIATLENGKTTNIANLAQEDLKRLSYWSSRSNKMAMTCWGTSQLFEARIALGRWMGWSDKDWPAFARKVENEIEVLN